jgi:hypothetical protein
MFALNVSHPVALAVMLLGSSGTPIELAGGIGIGGGQR